MFGVLGISNNTTSLNGESVADALEEVQFPICPRDDDRVRFHSLNPGNRELITDLPSGFGGSNKFEIACGYLSRSCSLDFAGGTIIAKMPTVKDPYNPVCPLLDGERLSLVRRQVSILGTARRHFVIASRLSLSLEDTWFSWCM